MNNHPQILAVVFDMDGLMFNTEDIYNQVGAAVLRRRGHEFTLELKLKMMGLPGHKAYQVMREHCGLDDSIEQLAAESDALFLDLLDQQICMMPGLAELLLHLEQAGLAKAVATSSSRQLAERALGRFDLIHRFQFVLTGDDVQNGKPAPDIYLLAAEKLGHPPANLLVLEDSPTGSRAGVAAGTVTVAVPNEHTADADFSHVSHRAGSLQDPLIYDLVGGRGMA